VAKDRLDAVEDALDVVEWGVRTVLLDLVWYGVWISRVGERPVLDPGFSWEANDDGGGGSISSSSSDEEYQDSLRRDGGTFLMTGVGVKVSSRASTSSASVSSSTASMKVSMPKPAISGTRNEATSREG